MQHYNLRDRVSNRRSEHFQATLTSRTISRRGTREKEKRKTVLCSRERSSAFERVKNPFGRALLPPLFIGHEQQQIRSNTYSITVHRLLPRSTATISLKPRPTGRFSSSIAPRPPTNRSRSYVRRQFTVPVTLDEPIADFVITMNVFKPLCTDPRDFRLQASRIRLNDFSFRFRDRFVTN